MRNINSHQSLIGSLLIFSLFLTVDLSAGIKQHYSVAADARFFKLLLNLIGSIHKTNFVDLEEISVYDLGLSKRQKAYLSEIQRTNVYDVERTNDQILEPILTSPSGRKVVGNFSWKPVIIRQSLERFPYTLYLDAGLCVMDNLESLFHYIDHNGYFLVSSGPHNIKDRITNYVIEQVIDKRYLEVKEYLLDENTLEIAAGIQGISRKMLSNYILPMYNFSKDIRLFYDDGSAKFGWGAGRHDQILFSILAHANAFNIFEQGYIKLDITNEESTVIYCHTQFNPQMTHVLINHFDRTKDGNFAKYIKFKKRKSY